MHQVVGVVRSGMAFCASRFAKEHLLTTHFGAVRLPGIELPIDTELRSRRKIEYLLKLRHSMYLATAVDNVNALLLRDHRVTVKIRGALLELGEVLDRFQSSLRAEDPLNINSAQGWSVNAMPVLLRPDITHEVRSPVGVAVRVTVEEGYSPARTLRPTVLRLIKLLLRELSDEQPQALQLLGIQQPVE